MHGRVPREKAVCPACKEPLVAVERNNFFFRHDHPNCYAGQGEGARHLSAKQILLSAIKKLAAEGKPLRITPRCASCAGPTTPVSIQLEARDEARAEHWTSPKLDYRADLAVLRPERERLLLEIVATNLCSPEKWSTLDTGSDLVAEIDVNDIVNEHGDPIWAPAQSVPTIRDLHFPEAYCCEWSPRSADSWA